jgi:starch synthase
MTMKLRILFLSAEAAPLAKIGGLGDVGGSLPPALQALPPAPDVRLVLPFYPEIKEGNWKLSQTASFTIIHTSGPIQADVFETNVNGVTAYLIDGSPIARSKTIYSSDPYLDGHKFTFFSLAAMELAKTLDWRPDIIHAHDWHTSLAVYKLKLNRAKDEFYSGTKSLLTIHNLPYLGHHTSLALQEFGLPQAHMSPLPEWAEHLPLPLGLLNADRINTVSKGYAHEILTQEFGARLEGFLKTREKDITGILNGLDLDCWDPETDPHLVKNYSSKTLKYRQENKVELLKELGLDPDPQKPLLAMINRMDHQKGVDLIPDALTLVSDLDWQAVILGTGDPKLEETSHQLDKEFAQVRSITRFDGELAHGIYGGSDIILIPSRYEPCGLTQMIGMRYGCVPLARATGGLKDTIQDYHQAKPGNGTGFLFEDARSIQLSETIRRALTTYKDKRRWGGIQRRGMKQDFSWERSAAQYLKLYQELTKT